MSAVDPFQYVAEGLDSPASKAVAVTPNDSADLTDVTRGLWVGGAGNLSLVFADDPVGSPVTITGVAAGTLLPFRVKRVRSTSTTATSIVAVY